MNASPSPAHNASQKTESSILREYYLENDFFLSAEGILKVLSVIVCIVSSVLYLGGGRCAGAPQLVASAATVALVCGAATALLYAGVLLAAPLYAPYGWLFTDIIVSTVMGVLLLVTAILSITLCEMNTVIDYMHGPLAIANAVMVTASAVITYARVMKKWDEARGPVREPPRVQPTEQEV